jgi:DNA-binding PadR family transcriptional regulator
VTGAGVSRFTAAPAPVPVLGATRAESRRDEFYDHLLNVCLLLLLQESAATSPQLRERLRPLGFEQVTTAVEAALDVLSTAGLVQSTLVRSADGRRTCVYSVTAGGSSWLRGATADLRRTEVVLGGFLARCGDRLLARS